MLQAADELGSSANSKYLIGVTAYLMFGNMTEALKTSRSCDEFKAANELLILVNTNMPAGGAVNKELAGQILGNAQQYGPFVDGNIKKLCK